MRTRLTIAFVIITSTLLNAQDFKTLLIDYTFTNTFEGYDEKNYTSTIDLKEVDKLKDVSIYINKVKNKIEIIYKGVVYNIDSYDTIDFATLYYSGGVQFLISPYIFEMYSDYDSDYNKYRYIESNVIKSSKNYYNEKTFKKYNKW